MPITKLQESNFMPETRNQVIQFRSLAAFIQRWPMVAIHELEIGIGCA